MPKIIDHDLQRREIAEKAIPLFREEGYRALSFRNIAIKLGFSKSGLYHYFKNKKELFEFCGKMMLSQDLADIRLNKYEDKVEPILELTKQWSEIFGDELRLLLDFNQYITTEPDQENLIKPVFDEVQNSLEQLVGPDKSYIVLTMILGELLIRSLTTSHSDWTLFEISLREVL